MNWREWLAPENIGFVAVGIVIGAIALLGVESACDADVAARTKPASLSPIGPPSTEPAIDAELLRCAQLPIEEAGDPACKALWAKERKRFLRNGVPAQPAERLIDMFPSYRPPTDGASPKPARKSE
ncbi:putative entry exclusion protein TrbK-alt [Methylocystis sp. IM3]|jgi:conjugative transfer region protein TrbK|uniref:putative entry exclusion protein TrbK-alt n=1 Tax=unclassified Methylocystis TaxID=2625913 RepID=UPI0030FD11FC